MSRGASVLVVAAIAAALAAFDVTFASIVGDSSARQIVMLASCNMIVALSLNIINGMAGQFSIGHAGFLAVGGYTAAIVAANLHLALGGGDPSFARSFVVVPAAIASAAIAAGAFGFVVGLPSLRLRGDYLAIVTLGFAEIVRLSIAGGSQGPLARLGGENGYAGPDHQGVPLYAGPFWVLGVTALVAVLAFRLKLSGWGRALRALREDEIAAASVGVDPTRYKVTSFVLSATSAGIAGALLAIMRDGTPIVQPDSYGFQTSFDAITMVIVGGSGSVSGAMIGGVIVTVTVRLIELVQGADAVQALHARAASLDLNALRMIVYAALLIALMSLRPGGILGERELFAGRLARRRARREAP